MLLFGAHHGHLSRQEGQLDRAELEAVQHYSDGQLLHPSGQRGQGVLQTTPDSSTIHRSSIFQSNTSGEVLCHLEGSTRQGYYGTAYG